MKTNIIFSIYFFVYFGLMIPPVFEIEVIVNSNDRNINLASVFYNTFKNCLIVIMIVCDVLLQLAKGVNNNMHKRKQIDNELNVSD